MRPAGTCVCHTLDTLIYLSGSQIRIEEPGPDGSTGTGRTTLLTLNSDSTLQSIQDPTGQAGGVNLYTFAGNDPINGADPFGTCKDGETRLRMEQEEDGTWVEICKDSNGDEVPETYTGISPATVDADQAAWDRQQAMLTAEANAISELDAFLQQVEQNWYSYTTCIDLNCEPFNDPAQMAVMRQEAAVLQVIVQSSCMGKKLSNRNDWIGSALAGAVWAGALAWKASSAIDPPQFIAGTIFTQVVGSGVSCGLGG